MVEKRCLSFFLFLSPTDGWRDRWIGGWMDVPLGIKSVRAGRAAAGLYFYTYHGRTKAISSACIFVSGMEWDGGKEGWCIVWEGMGGGE